MNPESLKTQLRAELKRVIASLDSGTVGIGFDCLCQHIRWERLPDMPRGTNSLYFAKQSLREVCAEKWVRGFVFAL